MARHFLVSTGTGCTANSTCYNARRMCYLDTDMCVSLLIGWTDIGCHLRALCSHTELLQQFHARCNDAMACEINKKTL